MEVVQSTCCRAALAVRNTRLWTPKIHMADGGHSKGDTGNGALGRKRGLCRFDIESAGGIVDFFSESARFALVCRRLPLSAAFLWCQKVERMPVLARSPALLPVPPARQQSRSQAVSEAARTF